jgi:hypothetical protein
MATLLALLPLLLQDDPLRVEGPPFLVYGETVELRAVGAARDASVVWRLADGAASGIETKPPLDFATRIVRGSDRLAVTSVGTAEAELLFVVSLERKGVRLAKEEFRMRIGPAIRVRAWVRIVEHAQGGTRKADLVRDSEKCRELEAGVNSLLRPLGVEVSLEPGRAVAAPDAWFDREGTFHPIVMKDGKKANSPTLNDLLKNDEPGGLNVYFLRDCQWVTVQEGFPRIRTDHNLVGIGLKDGAAVLDDAWDVPSLAHELGHTLGLDDLKEKGERGRMMYSVRRERSGQAFTYAEMKDARESARRHLKAWETRAAPGPRSSAASPRSGKRGS